MHFIVEKGIHLGVDPICDLLKKSIHLACTKKAFLLFEQQWKGG